MSRPRILDLFCGAGGCSVGYHRAGFDVVGVDIKPQPNYPFESIQADALDVLGEIVGAAEWFPVPSGLADWPVLRGLSFAAIHASPPCQRWTTARNIGNVRETPDLIEPVRPLLDAAGLPYVIENVPRAPLRRDLVLCGSMFGLDVRRHRVFELHGFTALAPACQHHVQTPRFPARASKGPRSVVSVFGRDTPAAVAGPAMGIDWMTNPEMGEAIPPAYTEHVGGYLMAAIRQETAA